jgi:hypothetical protein
MLPVPVPSPTVTFAGVTLAITFSGDEAHDPCPAQLPLEPQLLALLPPLALALALALALLTLLPLPLLLLLSLLLLPLLLFSLLLLRLLQPPPPPPLEQPSPPPPLPPLPRHAVMSCMSVCCSFRGIASIVMSCTCWPALADATVCDGTAGLPLPIILSNQSCHRGSAARRAASRAAASSRKRMTSATRACHMRRSLA